MFLNPKKLLTRSDVGLGYDRCLLDKKRSLIDALIQKTKPKSILDFGGGTGYTFSRYINENYPEIDITLFDVSVESLGAAAWHGQRIEKISDPALLRARQFDLVIASEVVEHIDVSHFVLHDIAVLMKPNGFLFATIPNGYGSYEITVFLYRLFVKPIFLKLPFSVRRGQSESTLSSSPHVSFYTYPTLISAFKCAGLVVEDYLPIVLSHFRTARALSEHFPWAMRVNIDPARQVNPFWLDDWGFLLTRSDTVSSKDCKNAQELKLLTRLNIFRAKLYRHQAL